MSVPKKWKPAEHHGKAITHAAAKKLMADFQKSDYYKKAKVRGGYFGKKKLLAILNHPDCIGLRYYHGHNAKKKHTLVLVGVHKTGKPIVTTFMDDGPLCPPYCT